MLKERRSNNDDDEVISYRHTWERAHDGDTISLKMLMNRGLRRPKITPRARKSPRNQRLSYHRLFKPLIGLISSSKC